MASFNIMGGGKFDCIAVEIDSIYSSTRTNNIKIYINGILVDSYSALGSNVYTAQTWNLEYTDYPIEVTCNYRPYRNSSNTWVTDYTFNISINGNTVTNYVDNGVSLSTYQRTFICTKTEQLHAINGTII